MITVYLGIAIVITILVLIYVYSGLTFNIYLVIYIIGAIVVLAGGTITSVNSGKTLAAVLFICSFSDLLKNVSGNTGCYLSVSNLNASHILKLKHIKFICYR